MDEEEQKKWRAVWAMMHASGVTSSISDYDVCVVVNEYNEKMGTKAIYVGREDGLLTFDGIGPSSSPLLTALLARRYCNGNDSRETGGSDGVDGREV